MAMTKEEKQILSEQLDGYGIMLAEYVQKELDRRLVKAVKLLSDEQGVLLVRSRETVRAPRAYSMSEDPIGDTRRAFANLIEKCKQLGLGAPRYSEIVESFMDGKIDPTAE